MKYAFALAALAGIAAAQPHVGHEHLHKKREMKTVTDWTVVTVTDIVTVYGPSPAPSPSSAAAAAPPVQSSPAAAPPAQSSPAQAPPAQSPSAQSPPAQPKTTEQPKAPEPTSAAPPAPPASSAAAAAPPTGGSDVGNYGTQPGASAAADCTKDAPCKVGMTQYETGLGACGYDDSAPNNEDTVALQMDMFGSVTNSGPNSPTNKLCNKKIMITNPANGNTATGVIRDRCQGCTGAGGIDLSLPLWNKLNDNAPPSRVPVQWYFLD